MSTHTHVALLVEIIKQIYTVGNMITINEPQPGLKLVLSINWSQDRDNIPAYNDTIVSYFEVKCAAHPF